jgi:tRNA A37 threonylcarbamoyladenosine dehydratase
MWKQFSRTQLLLGESAMEILANARVAVFGVGGVGSYAVEALARSGVGALDLIDHDRVCLSNLNRQIHATSKTVGREKVEVAAERVLEINPDCQVTTHPVFYGPDTAERFDFSQYDYIIDAIDTVTGKIALVLQARAAGVPIISSMGAGNKMDPTALVVGDIYETSVCPLARVMRKELKKRGVKALKVVYSRELPLTPKEDVGDPDEPDAEASAEEASNRPRRRQTPGSNAFVPPAAGLIIAAEVVKDLTGWKRPAGG